MVLQLETVREINTACWANVNGKNDGVYCWTPTKMLYRVIRARTVRGRLQVCTVSGSWVLPSIVYSL